MVNATRTFVEMWWNWLGWVVMVWDCHEKAKGKNINAWKRNTRRKTNTRAAADQGKARLF
jgi:hypothetical protein